VDQLTAIGDLQEDNKRLEATIAERTHRFPPKLETTVRNFISEHPKSTALLERLMVNKECEDLDLRREQDGPDLMASGILVPRQVRSYYGGADYAYSISDLHRPIVAYILYEENQEMKT
jgi:hypothetical protein